MKKVNHSSSNVLAFYKIKFGGPKWETWSSIFSILPRNKWAHAIWFRLYHAWDRVRQLSQIVRFWGMNSMVCMKWDSATSLIIFYIWNTSRAPFSLLSYTAHFDALAIRNLHYIGSIEINGLFSGEWTCFSHP